MRRFGGTLAVVLVATAAVLLPDLAAPARADEGLRWETVATYTFDSPAGVVRAQVEADLRNELRNERDGNVIRQPYFAGVTIAVANDAANLVATGDGTPLSVALSPSDGGEFQWAEIDFADNLFAGESVHLVVNYDLTGAPPRSDAPERINPAYASFLAYGIGDPGLTTVRVIIPETFEFESFGADAAESLESGFRVLTATDIEDPQAWTMLVSARNDEALVSTTGTAGDVAFDVRAWPNDPEWASFASGTITSGLPVLTELVGLPWPIDHPLEVRETITPYLYGYAGWFDGATGDIEVGEDLDQEVMLHELSHAWFNHDLFADRWVNEGLAQAYANRAVAATGGVAADPPAVDTTAAGFVLLDQWDDVDLVGGEIDDAREQYGYDTSWYVIDALADEIGEERMAAIFSAAQLNENAYPGDVATSGPTLGAEDWHTLLDLAEEAGGSTGFEALLRSYVATADDVALLDARAAARAAYDALEATGGAWQVPAGIRRSMSEWAFPAATEEIAAAAGVLESRDDVAAKAGALELTPPVGAEAAFEEAGWREDTIEELGEVSAELDEQHLALADLFEIDGALDEAGTRLAELNLSTDLATYAEPARDAFEAGTLDDVTGLVDGGATEIAAWMDTATLLGAAAATADAPRSFFADVGLRGTDVNGMLDEARDAFRAGDRQRATDLAEDVQRKLDEAESTGKRRVIIGGAVLALLLATVGVLVVVLRRRRRRRRAASELAGAENAPGWGPPGGSSAGAEQPVGGVVGGVEQLDAELLERHVAGGAEAGERGEEGQPPPVAGVEHEGHE
jgi:hypothetical protein